MIKAIFAIDAFGGMGLNNKLPWPSCKEDLSWFVKNTKEQTVVMGRKTWESSDMPSPLPNRRNIVICKNRYYKATKADVWGEDWVDKIRTLDKNTNGDVWIIGGPSLLEQAKPWIKEFYVTRFKGAYRTDTKLDIRKYFLDLRCLSVTPSKEGNQCTFEVYIPWLNI